MVNAFTIGSPPVDKFSLKTHKRNVTFLHFNHPIITTKQQTATNKMPSPDRSAISSSTHAGTLISASDVSGDRSSELGKGSCGVVYAATTRSNMPVAVKQTLDPKELAHEALWLERLQRELDPNSQKYYRCKFIVDYYGVSKNSAGVITELYMEPVKGFSVDKLMDNPHLIDDSERPRILHEIALALRYIHSRGIIHGDYHGGNMIVTQDGHKVKVIDFGLAKEFGNPKEHQAGFDIEHLAGAIRCLYPSKYRDSKVKSLIEACENRTITADGICNLDWVSKP